MNMRFTSIVIVDIDAGVSLAERKAYAAAQQRQIVEHFAPCWRIEPCTVRAATPEAPPKSGEVQIRLLNKPTQSGALGYHGCLPDGTPVAYVFVGLAKHYGDTWTSIASHEVLELLADPLLRRCVQMHDGFWDSEVADRVEADSYVIDGVTLSDFNTPESFEPPANLTGVKFDWLGKSTQPNEVLPGGYAQRFDPKRGWVQVGQMRAYRSHMAELGISRGARRVGKTAPPRPWWRRLLGL